jgi:hypothetical protein
VLCDIPFNRSFLTHIYKGIIKDIRRRVTKEAFKPVTGSGISKPEVKKARKGRFTKVRKGTKR